MEKDLTNDLNYAIDCGTEDLVVGAWGNYFGYIRNLDALESPFDHSQYKKNLYSFRKWKREYLQKF